MTESIGKQLCQARIKRRLTIDEAAHATKLRPDKVVALENDDYTRFPSNAYAKGFLQIYGKFLGVDVSEYAALLDTSNPIALDDYQYLNNAAPAKPATRQEHFEHTKRSGGPSIFPLLFFFGLIIAAFFGFTAYVNWQRVTADPALHPGDATPVPDAVVQATPQPAPAPAPAVATPVPVISAQAVQQSAQATPAPVPRQAPLISVAPATPLPIQPGPAVAVSPATPAPAPAATPPLIAVKPNARISDQELLNAPLPDAAPVQPVQPQPVPNNDRDFVSPTQVQMNDIEVAALKKTWIVVRRDDANSAPVFEDYIYPSARPLKLRGTRFIIEAKDPTAVQISKNGAPIAYQTAAVTIQ